MEGITLIEKWDVGSEEWIVVEDIETLLAGDLIRKTFANGSVVTAGFVETIAPDPAEVLQDKLRELYLYAKLLIERRESWYAAGERYLWAELESECAAYLDNPEIMGRNLTMQEALGLPAAVNAPRVVAAADALVLLVSAVVVNRTAHRTAIEVLAAANDLNGIMNYDFSSGWPAI